MTLVVDDPDFRLHQGDVLTELAAMADGSVDCVITSPPYWGLRDYQTGSWDGGNPDCDHLRPPNAKDETSTLGTPGHMPGANTHQNHAREPWPNGQCGRCGAVRVDQQLGLEATPDLYVTAMVAVFREVRRVLADHGTAWINLGDSYIAGQGGRQSAVGEMPTGTLAKVNTPRDRTDIDTGSWGARDATAKTTPARGTTDLKPKDLAGIPWMVAFALRADGWYLRSEIIWHKPAPMPESVTDRPTKAHEQIFLLTKRARYFYDAEAIREPHTHDGRRVTTVTGRDGSIQHRDGERWPGTGRNARSVWTINAQPFTDWASSVRRRPVAADEPVDGKKRTTSPDCPVHGDRPAPAPTASDDGRAAGGSTRNERTDDRLGQKPLAEIAPTDQTRAPAMTLASSRSPVPAGSPIASGRSTGTRRTLEPTVSDDTASGRTASRIAHTSPSHESPAPDGSGIPDSFGTPGRTDCTCTWYVEYTEKTSHFATYPEDLVRRCLLAGCPAEVCRTCGKPRERLADVTYQATTGSTGVGRMRNADPRDARTNQTPMPKATKRVETVGWSDCGHGDYRPGVVLDPFLGSGTTALVARRHGRRCVGVELNAEYADLAARRLQQLSLLAEGAA